MGLSLLAHGLLLGAALFLSRPIPPSRRDDVGVSFPKGLLHRGEAVAGVASTQGHQPGPKRPAEKHRLSRRPRPGPALSTGEEPPRDLGGEGPDGDVPASSPGGPECATPPCGEAAGEVLTDDVVAELPVLLSGPEVTLPAEARRGGVEGTMLVRCLITASGSVERCEVLKGLPVAEAVVLGALQARRYRPARVEGRAVSVRHLFTIKIGQAP